MWVVLAVLIVTCCAFDPPADQTMFLPSYGVEFRPDPPALMTGQGYASLVLQLDILTPPPIFNFHLLRQYYQQPCQLIIAFAKK